MSVAVVIPFRSNGDPHRERALTYVTGRYRESHPDWELVVAEAPTGPWCKALAVMPAVESVDVDTVIVGDADCWSDGIAEAVRAVEEGAPYGIPHREVWRLSAAATDALIAGRDWHGLPLDQRPYVGQEAGGVLVAKRGTLLDVPMDPRFVGWGQEDASWAMALHHLVGPAWRGTAPLLHLWHTPPTRMDRKRGSPENWALFRRYCQARYRPGELRQLLDEANDSLDAAQHSLHPGPTVNL